MTTFVELNTISYSGLKKTIILNISFISTIEEVLGEDYIKNGLLSYIELQNGESFYSPLPYNDLIKVLNKFIHICKLSKYLYDN